MNDLGKDLQAVYEAMEGSDASLQYSERHGICAQAVLTVHDDETAALICERFHDQIAGKTVVEIGGGIGLLSLHMGMIAYDGIRERLVEIGEMDKSELAAK